MLSGYSSCRQKKEEPPIPEPKMQQILLDIHLAETYSQGLGDSVQNKFEKNYDSLGGFYTTILKHHKISFEEFNDALNWYRERPIRIDSLYTRVLNDMNELKAKFGIRDLEDEKEGDQSVPPPPPSSVDTQTVKKSTTLRNKPITVDTAAKAVKDTVKKKKTKPKPTVRIEP